MTLDEDHLSAAEGLILPVANSSSKTSSNSISADNGDNTRDMTSTANNTNVNQNMCLTPNSLKRGVGGEDSASKMKLFDDSDYLNQSLSSFNESSANIEPISISLNDCDEESDNESERNSDQISDKSQTPFEYNSRGDYGIKTLEQIRMEKVFNSESEDIDIDDNNQCYIKNDSQLKTQKQVTTNTSKDLRVKIKRQKFGNDSTFPSASNPNRISSNTTSTKPLPDLGIKSLAQIRKEREDLSKKGETNADNQNGLKENQEPKGVKRSGSDPNPPVVKIRRTGPIAITSLKVQQNEGINCHQNIDTNSDPTLTADESSNQSNVVSSTDANRKHRLTSIDTDSDDFDLFDGESAQNMDSNDAIDDEDDELMREINQVINS